jgi:uncharacterized membrane protein YkoI
MSRIVKPVLAVLLVVFSTLFVMGFSVAAEAAMVTKDQAITMALKTHPGKVLKAYKEVKKGQDVWEVSIDGDDGKEWELYYDMAGNLIAEDAD